MPQTRGHRFSKGLRLLLAHGRCSVSRLARLATSRGVCTGCPPDKARCDAPQYQLHPGFDPNDRDGPTRRRSTSSGIDLRTSPQTDLKTSTVRTRIARDRPSQSSSVRTGCRTCQVPQASAVGPVAIGIGRFSAGTVDRPTRRSRGLRIWPCMSSR